MSRTISIFTSRRRTGSSTSPARFTSGRFSSASRRDRRFIGGVHDARSDPDLRVRRKSLETYQELEGAAEFSATVTRLKSEVEQLKEENSQLAKAAAG